ncbi:hypothetical protein BKA67DRAFT_540427 [Truncatella angustata]|uniref:Uncharacterized protein n=1 Tax=Truncatella angustata TaxID=152316 RepID=A0A9P8RPJ1_9PEZI|nr:uncharacterized protein BKA67DRAFT_540427 [Truncatella angustata]KAH6646960.1 hypothetical protein BKA67DRAFT_540427 [Truncatella angustata]
MSSTVTSASASPTCGSTLYNIPVDDAACAMPYGGNHTDIMAACCKSAAVISYYDNCGVYCLAIDQSISDLTDCMYKNGAPYGNEVFCHGNTSATATGDASSTPTGTSVGASIVASATDASKTGHSTSSGTSSSSTSSSSGNAAPRSHTSYSITTLGLTVGALLFSATTLGAFAL